MKTVLLPVPKQFILKIYHRFVWGSCTRVIDQFRKS